MPAGALAQVAIAAGPVAGTEPLVSGSAYAYCWVWMALSFLALACMAGRELFLAWRERRKQRDAYLSDHPWIDTAEHNDQVELEGDFLLRVYMPEAERRGLLRDRLAKNGEDCW